MAESKATNRVRRSAINGTRNRLNIRGKEDGYVYRIVNDVDDRIQTFLEMGYELVTDPNVTVGDKRVALATKEGSPQKVSVGQGIQGYVMRQKQEYFDEDQKAKQEKVNELETSIKRDAETLGLKGSIKLSRD
jgi:hypothetical protein